VKGSKTQVLIERDGFRELRCLDRKANESLILRLKSHTKNLCLFWQAEWIDTASGVRWAGGERVFVDDDVWQNLCGIELHRDQVAREACPVGQATMTTTIQGL